MTNFRFIIPVLTLAMASPVMAADVNTYRPGQPYAVSQMPSADVCAMQCSGDAQCYGWNFMQSRAPNGSGVCELNSSSAAPVRHPFAVSGDNGGRSFGASNVVQGKTRTFRIGNPQAAMPAQATPQAMQSARIQAAPQRRRVEAPVVRKRTFAPAQTQEQPRQAARPQNPNMQRAVQTPAQAQMQRQAHPQMRAPQQAPQNLPASTPRRPAAMPRAPYGQMQARPQMQRPQNMRPQAVTPPARPATAPQPQAAPHARPQAAAPRPPVPAQAQIGYPQAAPMPAPMAPAPAPKNDLYGSLYDVPEGPTSGQAVAAFGRRMAGARAAQAKAQGKAAPKAPLYSERPAENPNAPIATAAKAAPVKPINRTGLEMAGPAPR